jgi:hypothetical protein
MGSLVDVVLPLLPDVRPPGRLNLVTKKRLERRGAAAVARTALRPVCLTGGQPARIHREHRWHQWARHRVGGLLEDDGIDVEPESQWQHRPDRR